jgi:hypothetical protein
MQNMKSIQTAKYGALLALAATALIAAPTPAAAGGNWTVNSVSDLIAAITAANQAHGANTITLAPGATFTLTAVNNTGDGPTGLPVIAAQGKLTILGNGATIARSTDPGTPAFRLFDVAAGAALTLQNLTLANGLVIGDPAMNGNGGAILNAAGASLTVEGSAFVGNQVVGGDGGGGLGGLAFGGALWNDGTAKLDSVIFRGNQATGGATTSPDPTQPDTILGGLAFGGAISSQNHGTLTVRNCWFTGNKAIGGHRHQPSAHYDGAGASGAIDNWGAASISGTTFTDNQAIGSTADEGVGAGYGFGGALGSGGPLAQSPACTIQGCRFSHNQAMGGGNAGPNEYGGTGLGGALSTGYAQINGAMTITECVFNDNQAMGGEAGQGGWGAGGVINQESPLTFGRKSTLTIANSMFTNNQAVASGVGGAAFGGAIVNQDWNFDGGSGATLVISNCTFSGNEALAAPGGDGYYSPGYGCSGAVDAAGNTTVLSSTFKGNRAIGGALGPGATANASTSSYGGALSSGYGTLKVHDCSFVGNQVIAGDGSLGGPPSIALGGGIMIWSGMTASLVNCSLVDNAAVGGAGGSGTPGAAGLGGGLSVGYSAVTLSGTIIRHNQAVGGAGGGTGMGGGYAVGFGALFFDVPDNSSIKLNGGSVVTNNLPDDAFQF